MVSYVAQTQTTTSGVNPAVIIVLSVVGLALVVFVIASMWKVFTKAGQPGWAAIVPFYNLYVLCRVGGKPGWWFVLLILPVLNIIFGIIVAIAIANNFGKGGAFGFFLLWLLPYIGYPILGFGDARYVGGHRQQQAAATY